MKSKAAVSITFAIAIFVLGGCSVSDSNYEDTTPTVARTFPNAFSLKTITVQQLRNETIPPDSVNLDVFITGINVCPENASCFIPDGIFIVESLNPQSSDERYHFAVQEPGQFKEKQFYSLSVKVRGNESGNRTFFDLLGYSKLQSDD